MDLREAEGLPCLAQAESILRAERDRKVKEYEEGGSGSCLTRFAAADGGSEPPKPTLYLRRPTRNGVKILQRPNIRRDIEQ